MPFDHIKLGLSDLFFAHLYIDSVCLTSNDSKDPGKECVFPFTHDNFTYYGCPIDPIDETKRWCSTKTNGTGVHITGNWGYCSSYCKPARGVQNITGEEYDDYDDLWEEEVCLTSSDSVDPEKECVFPFTYNNFTYHGCPRDPKDKTRRWCSTKTDDNGVHIDNNDTWGYCTSSCYPEIFPGKIIFFFPSLH